jgi:tetratricopeptide (TPR) repeat protein
MTLYERFFVPYEKNENFTGREKLLETLHLKLSEIVPKQWNHRVALYGLGGVGKTQLALEYAYTQKDNYERIYWISAVNEATLFSGFQEIAKRTRCISDYSILKPLEVAERVLHWLNEQKSWLLVLDNLDDINVVNGYLPDRSPRKHTLITTRLSHCHQIPAEGLQVEVLDVTDATNLLFLRSHVGTVETPDGKAEAIEIVKELGFLPLAIEQAAAYIREASKNVFKFLPNYRNSRMTHHARASKGIQSCYVESVATTWRMSFQRIEENNTDASKLLRLLAFLNPDGILVDFLDRGNEGLNAELREIITNEDRFYEALCELERFSMIERHDECTNAQHIVIHRLVQSVIKDEMSPEDFSTMAEAVIGLCDCAFPRQDDWSNEMLLQRRRYQEQIVTPLSSIQQIKSSRLGRLLRRVGEFLTEDGKYQQAGKLLETAIVILGATRGSEHLDTLRAIFSLGLLYHDQGRWEDAANLEGKVLEARRRLHGEEHPDTLSAMANMAVTYCDQGRWGEAAKLQEKLLEIQGRLLGEEHPKTLREMRCLAQTYSEHDQWEDAAKLGAKAFEAMRRLLGKEHPDTLRVMANLAATYNHQGRWEEACKLQEKVLEARKRILGEEHPSTLMVMAELGCSYRDQGRLEDAIRLLEGSTAAGKTILGHEHPETLRMMTNLATVYQKQRKLVAAIGLLERTEEILTRRLANEHPIRLWTMSCLARAYQEDGRLNDSIKLFEYILDTRKRVLGEQHRYTLETANDLESAYRALQEGLCCPMVIAKSSWSTGRQSWRTAVTWSLE